MRKSLQLILFLKAFLLGTIAPIFILLLTTHGATVQTVSLFVGLASLFTLLFEFPSGVFADLFGRKRSFVLAVILQMAAYALLLWFRSALALAGAMVVYGLSRAFVSGSIEALAIDEAEGKAPLVRVTSRLNVLESAGLAIGSLCSGALAGLAPDYTANILLGLLGYGVILTLTRLTVSESAYIGRNQAQTPRLKEHLQKSFSFVRSSRIARMLLVLTAITAFAMVTVETFWQPAFRAFSASPLLFGVVGFLGFGGVVLGSKLAEFLLTRLPQRGIALFLLSKALMGACVSLLFAMVLQVPFILVYMLWYVFLGSGGVAEQTLLNHEAPARQRASILSLLSFVFRGGSVLASVYCYGITAGLNYRYAWLIAGLSLSAVTLLYAVAALRRASRQQAPLPPQTAADANHS